MTCAVSGAISVARRGPTTTKAESKGAADSDAMLALPKGWLHRHIRGRSLFSGSAALGGEKVASVACGFDHTLLTMQDGRLLVCGNNAQVLCGAKWLQPVSLLDSQAQLGLGDKCEAARVSEPTAIASLTGTAPAMVICLLPHCTLCRNSGRSCCGRRSAQPCCVRFVRQRAAACVAHW